MTIARFAAVAASAIALSACHFTSKGEVRDPGATVDRSYQVAAFDRIAVSGPYEVSVTTGGQPGVTANGGEKFLEETEVVVENGVLKIRTKRNNIRWTWHKEASKVRFEVTTAMLHGAAIAGSGAIRVDRVAGGDFKGEVAGSGDLDVGAVDAGAVSLAIAGSGKVRAAGKAQKVDISIAGSGDIDVAALQVTDASLSVAGSGNVRANASGSADVSIMGSGDVEISGGAKCNVSKNGSGDVRCS